MITFPVSDAKAADLRARMEALNLREADLQETFIRASGPGGQNVNKVATAVRLRHAPSGLEVKMQRARTQGLNRFLARRALVELLEGSHSVPAHAASKARKQKDRRRRRAKIKDTGHA